MLSALPPVQPGPYPGSGQASLLRTNSQVYLFNNQIVAASTQSIAVQLERICRQFYPWGAALQIFFGGAPGAFEVDFVGSETDLINSYISLGTGITAVNTSNYGRYDMSNVYFPKYVAALVKTLTNPVPITAILTR